MEVSKRTIHRDIEELCQAGVPIASSTGQFGGYYLLNGYTSSMKCLCVEIIEIRDSCVVVNLFSFANAVNCVWELKHNVAVIEPDELRQHICDLAELLLKKYT